MADELTDEQIDAMIAAEEAAERAAAERDATEASGGDTTAADAELEKYRSEADREAAAMFAMQERIAMRKLEMELKRQDEELAQLEAFYEEELERQRKAEENAIKAAARKAEIEKKRAEQEARQMEEYIKEQKEKEVRIEASYTFFGVLFFSWFFCLFKCAQPFSYFSLNTKGRRASP
jgi:Fe2+ transport system protein B